MTPSQILDEAADEPTSVAPWTRIDYDNPATLPEPDSEVLFYIMPPEGSRRGQWVIGYWNPRRPCWVANASTVFAPQHITHWMPLPALPEGQMTDTRIAIVEEWTNDWCRTREVDQERESYARLLAKLDAHAAAQHSASEVERVARALWASEVKQYPGITDCPESLWFLWVNRAKAALSAMPPRDDAERFVEFVRDLLPARGDAGKRLALIALELDRLDAARGRKL